jgi:hypothetical protein
MTRSVIKITVAVFFAVLLLAACKEKQEDIKPASVSYVVSDSLKAWCKNKLPENRISYEGSTIKLLFFQEDLDQLWKPAYAEAEVKELAAKEQFNWQELPVHEGNRRWELSMPLQEKDSTYITPNNLLLYLFR